MGGSLLPIFTVLSLAFSVSHAATTSQDYWNQMLPNTPMPSAVRDHLGDDVESNSNEARSQNHQDGTITQSVAVDPDVKEPLFFAYPHMTKTDVTSGVHGDDVASNSNEARSHNHHDGTITHSVAVDPDVKEPLFFAYPHMTKPDVTSGVHGDQPASKSDEGRSHNHDTSIVTDPVTKEPNLIYHSRKVHAGVRQVPEGEAAAAGHSGSTQGRIDRPGAPCYFLEKDLRVGARIKTVFKRSLSGDNFLHREAAKTIPFSSDKLPQILRRFSVQPGTLMAKSMERTLRDCELPAARGEKKICATSLEAMVDFVTSSLGTHDLRTLTTVAGKDAPDQVYTVESWSAVPSPTWTASVCHVGAYPYTIFQCHMIPMTKPYVVKLVGEDGTRVDSAVVCHADTSTWSETFYVLRAFSLKPGKATAVCHFILEGVVVWIPLGGVGEVAAA